MALTVKCKRCGRSYDLPDGFKGRELQCSSCGKIVYVDRQNRQEDSAQTVDVADTFRQPESSPAIYEQVAEGTVDGRSHLWVAIVITMVVIIGCYFFIDLESSSKQATPTRSSVTNKSNLGTGNIPRPPQIKEPSRKIPVFRQPQQPLPANGAVKRFQAVQSFAPELTIEAPVGASSHYFIKLVRLSDGQPALTVFLRAGQRVQVSTPIGEFVAKFANGNNWYGADYLFGPDTRYFKTDSVIQMTKSVSANRDSVTNYTIELTKQINGNLTTTDLSADEF